MNLQNIYKLGYKEASTPDSYADQLLGIEYSFEDVDLNSSASIKPLRSSNRVHAIWVQNTHGSTTFAPGSLVRFEVPGRTVNAQAGLAAVADGVVDPYLTAGPAPGERFFVIVKGPCPVLSSTSYSANALLACDSAGKAMAASSGVVATFARAIEAATGADQLRRALVDCSVSRTADVGLGSSRVLRTRFTAAQVNAGTAILPALPNFRYRVHDMALIAIGGNAAGATSVDIRATQSASSVNVLAAAVAGLTQNTLLRAGAANAAILAGGVSFVPNDVNTAITIAKTGSDLSGATSVDVLLTYSIEA